MKYIHILMLIAASIFGLGALDVAVHPAVHAAPPPIQLSTPVCDHWAPLNTTANVQIITGSGSNFIYVCSISLVSATAQNIALVEGTGSTCGTNTAGMAGGATAATGWNLPINGIISFGSGTGAVAHSAVAGDNVCLLTSSTGQISGVISWTAANF